MKAQLSVKIYALGLPQHRSDVRALFSQLSIALLSSDPRRQKRARMITSAPIASFALLFTNSLANFIAKHERTAYRDHRFHLISVRGGLEALCIVISCFTSNVSLLASKRCTSMIADTPCSLSATS